MNKKHFIILILLIILINISPVLSWEWDNVKDYDKETKTITITNALGLGDIIATYQLIENTNYCINCYAKINATLFEPDKLFSDINFYNTLGKEREIKNRINIKVENEYTRKITITKEVCKDYETELNVTSDGTTKRICSEEITGYENETYYLTKWEEYKFEDLEVGDYEILLEGNIGINNRIDWIVNALGKDLNEWDWWNSDWTYCKNITIQDSSGIAMTDYPVVLESFNTTGRGQANGQDIRVTDAGCGLCDGCNELSIGINQLGTDEFNITFRANWSASGTSTFAVYYVNAGASGVNKTYNEIRYNSYDNFSSGVLNTTLWIGDDVLGDTSITNSILNYGSGGAIRSIYTSENASDYMRLDFEGKILSSGVSYFGLGGGEGAGSNAILFYYEARQRYYWVKDDVPTNVNTITAWDANEYNNFTIVRQGATNTTIGHQNDINDYTKTNGYPTTEVETFGFIGRAGTDLYLKWFGNRKYVTSEPVISFGMEEVTSLPPLISLNFPLNDTYFYSPNVNFTYNVSDFQVDTIDNCSIYFNEVLNQTDLTITHTINQTFNYTTIPYGDTLWKVECWNDINENSNSSIFNYSRRSVNPTVTAINPNNNTYFSTKHINFTYNVTIVSGSISECYLWLNNSVTENLKLNYTDTSITQVINQTMNITLGNEHNYNWLIECESNFDLKANSTTRTFRFNTAPTTPTTIGPINNSITVGEQNLTCSGSTDGEDIINYAFWGGIDPTSLSLLQNSSLTTYTWSGLTDNIFYWFCRANDNITSSSWTDMRRIIVIGSSSFNVSHNISCIGGLTPAMCWDYKDEENLTSLNASIDYNFEINLTNSSVLKIFGSHDNINATCFCVNSTLYSNYSLAYGEIQYEKFGYVDRRYYAFVNTRLTDVQINDTLFLLLNGKSTSFLFEFVSTALSPYENHYTTLNRWYPDLDTYDVVDMGKTDNKGQTIMHVVSEDVDYRVGLYRVDGTLIKLLDPIRFACLDSPCTYSALIAEEPLDYVEFLNVETSLTYSAGIFTMIYNDPSQNTEEMTLKVYKETGTSTLELCTDSSTGYTGVLTCNVSIYTGQLRAIAYRSASPEITIAQMIVNTVSTVFKGNTGLFVSLFMFLILVFIGSLYGPVPTLIFGIIALIPAVIFGTLTTEIVIGLGTLVGIAIHFMKRVGT